MATRGRAVELQALADDLGDVYPSRDWWLLCGAILQGEALFAFAHRDPRPERDLDVVTGLAQLQRGRWREAFASTGPGQIPHRRTIGSLTVLGLLVCDVAPAHAVAGLVVDRDLRILTPVRRGFAGYARWALYEQEPENAWLEPRLTHWMSARGELEPRESTPPPIGSVEPLS